jgi:hypothetical protein
MVMRMPVMVLRCRKAEVVGKVVDNKFKVLIQIVAKIKKKGL